MTTLSDLRDRVLAGSREDREHVWHERFNLTCCKVCGYVKRRDGKNRPCRGPVKLTLREAQDEAE